MIAIYTAKKLIKSDCIYLEIPSIDLLDPIAQLNRSKGLDLCDDSISFEDVFANSGDQVRHSLLLHVRLQ